MGKGEHRAGRFSLCRASAKSRPYRPVDSRQTRTVRPAALTWRMIAWCPGPGRSSWASLLAPKAGRETYGCDDELMGVPGIFGILCVWPLLASANWMLLRLSSVPVAVSYCTSAWA